MNTMPEMTETPGAPEVTLLTKADYRSPNKPTWCVGCGDYAVLDAITRALASLQVDPDKLAVVSGIGCSSRLPVFLRAYGFHSVHGRVLPVATGVKLANPELVVLAVGGDGDGLAIGASHFVHAARRNINVTYVMMDNSIYGLTKGQTSPTSKLEAVTGTSPYGNLEPPIDPVTLSLAAGATFVARGFASKVEDMANLIRAGIEHDGFAFIHAISPCVTFNNTFKALAPLITGLPEDHDPTNRTQAVARAVVENRIYAGLFYQDKTSVSFGELVRKNVARRFPRASSDFAEVLEQFR